MASGDPREVGGHDLKDVAGLAAAFDANGLNLTGLVGASVADWNHYESQHWANA